MPIVGPRRSVQADAHPDASPVKQVDPPPVQQRAVGLHLEADRRPVPDPIPKPRHHPLERRPPQQQRLTAVEDHADARQSMGLGVLTDPTRRSPRD